MRTARVLILLAFAAVLALPLIVRSLIGASGPGTGRAADNDEIPPSRTVVIVTPHVEQIAIEFSHAFEAWHLRVFGERAKIDWRGPYGTSEIIKQLEAQFQAAVKNGRIRRDVTSDDFVCEPGTIGYDLMLGGGSYEHGQLKRADNVRLTENGKDFNVPMSIPAGFSQQQLDAWYGENKIGAQKIYDADQYWLGTALSGFGIVFNRDRLKELGLQTPRTFADLCDPRYRRSLALADPRLSGSVTTTYESILNKEGWDEGWRILREMCANARYFATASTRPPIDVSQGEAAAGLAIDFYGRGQAQVVARPGEDPSNGRVGYIDPEGAVYIDADPVSIMRGGPNPLMARRFVEFCLTEEAQSLWQFHPVNQSAGAANPRGDGGVVLGPSQYQLRRMPVRRVMYEKYLRYMVDQANPFALASDVRSTGWRPAIGPLMGAFGIDSSEELRRAWDSLQRARSRADFPPERLKDMERLFLSMPPHTMRDGAPHYLRRSQLDALSARARAAADAAKVLSYEGLRKLVEEMERQTANETGAGAGHAELVNELRTLLSSEHDNPKPSPYTVPFDADHFAAIKADTDQWKDAVHGRRALIGYTEYFRRTYAEVARLGDH